MRPRVRLPGMFVLASLLAVLLGALAGVQYHWVGQLSADERERIKDSLRDSADEFTEDFNRELTRAFFWLQVGPEVRRDGPPDTDAQRYERWFNAAPHPELISTIYHVEVDENGKLSLQQFVRAEPRLQRAEWPDALEPIRKAIIERSQQSASTPPQAQRPPFSRVPVLWPDVPAIIVPRLRVVTSSPSPGLTMRQLLLPQPVPSGYVVAVLSDSYIKQQLIPRLVERHFTKGPDGALHVAVKGERDIVFATAGAVPKVLEHADVRQPLWDIRFHEFGRFVADRNASGPDGGRPPDGRDPGPPPPLVSILEQRERGAPGARRGGPDDDGRDGKRSADDRADAKGAAAAAGLANFTVMYRGGDDRGGGGGGRIGPRNLVAGPGWQVHVLHSAGSLDAAVARARSRNLLISFGVLLLLGASMTLVLISSARARRLAAQQMEFVAGVSHELRTPLAVIRSAAENLADGIVDDEKQVRRYGQLIASEGRRLTQMVEQVMTFAGLQAGRPGFDVRPIDVGPVVEDALSAVAPMAREQSAEIACEIASPLPRILADPSAVGRALQNLLGNALKYGGDPPRIQVTARQSAPQALGRPDVEIVVVDNGAGIAPRDLPHIFEPFYRGADAVARQIHGSGLGLSLVQRIMQELGGRVTVKSEPGHGSTFTLHLPIAPEAEVVAQPHGAAISAER